MQWSLLLIMGTNKIKEDYLPLMEDEGCDQTYNAAWEKLGIVYFR